LRPQEDKLKVDLDEMKAQLVVGDFSKTPLDQARGSFLCLVPQKCRALR